MSDWRVPANASLLIVSDVDGTLLDDRHCLPMPAFTMRKWFAKQFASFSQPVTFAFASSRTLEELVVLQRLLSLHGPLIAEDGGVAALPSPLTFGDDVAVHSVRMGGRNMVATVTGMPANALQDRLAWVLGEQPKLMLAAMDHDELALRGFDSERIVRRAITSRQASVLLDMDGLDSGVHHRLVDAARAEGLTIKRGGRWCTAVSGADKGRAVRLVRSAITRNAAPSLQSAPVFVVAIGNEENDVALLANADLPLVIRNPGRGHHPALLAVPGAVPLERTGTEGFLEMFDLITQHAEAIAS